MEAGCKLVVRISSLSLLTQYKYDVMLYLARLRHLVILALSRLREVPHHIYAEVEQKGEEKEQKRAANLQPVKT